MRAVLLLVVAFVAWCGVPGRAQAETCTATASTVSFGSVSPITRASVAATGTVSVTCTWSAVTLTPNVLVCLNLGGTSPRSLVNGTNAMQYDLYLDAAHSVAWGSVYSGTTPASVTLVKPALGTSASATVTVYGQITANQPTVPTTGNSTTTYSQTFGGNTTSINAGFYLLGAPTCASLTASNGTFPFSATANVINDCNISATNVNFGTASVLSGALAATGSITAQCTNGDAWKIALNGGGSGNVTARQMQRSGGGGAINYGLYTDAAHSVTWGDDTGGSATVTGVGTGTSQAVTVYGAVPAQTTPAPGNYSDTITATISF
ncbi:Csu type fimbrial protein [Burkholderia seminalis]|uniref:Spore coat protein U/FanG domain-containing protein n=1 Tax=Burkholderia cenocepacia TaxID=95486 RepID=A0A071MI42_9BURK|nr:spore coat U domain-containing protein [Burkholderia seminalis]MCA8422272.1 spore coat U domain-containing protein [Burkholderia seminalis]MCA8432106.1 spore coat U domain-containing protein [Burkholderia seminalis]QTO19849.1 spore coat protein U domain-containing protein [Burkholderia seminalis]VWC31961.1 lipoprotein [Burkholderia seminalis]